MSVKTGQQPVVIGRCPWENDGQQHTKSIVAVSGSMGNGAQVGCSCNARGPFAKDSTSAIALWNSWAHRAREIRLTVANLSDEERQELAKRIACECRAIELVPAACADSHRKLQPSPSDMRCIPIERLRELYKQIMEEWGNVPEWLKVYCEPDTH